MAFLTDPRLKIDAGRAFGEYMTTFRSQTGQVRAHIFRRGRLVEAHVSFRTGLDAGSVTDPYVSSLWTYARENGVQDQFKLILS